MPVVPPRAAPTSAFLPVLVRDAATAREAAPRVEVVLPNGVHMRIFGAHPDFVGRVAQLVGGMDLARRGDSC